jgi:serine/threonine protein phosphatase PrpC
VSAKGSANRRGGVFGYNDRECSNFGRKIIWKRQLRGDSRAYLLDSNGLHAITDDQTWVNEVGRPLGLDEQTLRRHPMRHVLTMAIGANGPLTVNCYSVAIESGSVALICSDGLHGVVEAEELQRILAAGRNGAQLDDICRQLVEAAKAAGGPDNVTVILLRKAA